MQKQYLPVQMLFYRKNKYNFILQNPTIHYESVENSHVLRGGESSIILFICGGLATECGGGEMVCGDYYEWLLLLLPTRSPRPTL